MATIYSDDFFDKTTLYTMDNSKSVQCTIKGLSGRQIEELFLSQGEGSLTGRMVNPPTKPDWLKNGTILKGNIRGTNVKLTVQPTFLSRITIVNQILGERINFSYKIVTVFTDG